MAGMEDAMGRNEESVHGLSDCREYCAQSMIWRPVSAKSREDSTQPKHL